MGLKALTSLIRTLVTLPFKAAKVVACTAVALSEHVGDPLPPEWKRYFGCEVGPLLPTTMPKPATPSVLDTVIAIIPKVLLLAAFGAAVVIMGTETLMFEVKIYVLEVVDNVSIRGLLSNIFRRMEPQNSPNDKAMPLSIPDESIGISSADSFQNNSVMFKFASVPPIITPYPLINSLPQSDSFQSNAFMINTAPVHPVIAPFLMACGPPWAPLRITSSDSFGDHPDLLPTNSRGIEYVGFSQCQTIRPITPAEFKRLSIKPLTPEMRLQLKI